jgi:hypothetical protein
VQRTHGLPRSCKTRTTLFPIPAKLRASETNKSELAHTTNHVYVHSAHTYAKVFKVNSIHQSNATASELEQSQKPLALGHRLRTGTRKLPHASARRVEARTHAIAAKRQAGGVVYNMCMYVCVRKQRRMRYVMTGEW